MYPWLPDPRLHDSLPESPVTWDNIKLGAGQTPSAFSHFQFTHEGSAYTHTDVRRDPDNLPPTVVVRYPERPW